MTRGDGAGRRAGAVHAAVAGQTSRMRTAGLRTVFR